MEVTPFKQQDKIDISCCLFWQTNDKGIHTKGNTYHLDLKKNLYISKGLKVTDNR